MADCWIGVDTGGTFTDLVLVDRESGRRDVHKLPTTPEDPARAIVDGIATLLARAGAAAADVAFLAHGTTLATNAVLTGRTARAGMIVTAGFRDVLEIGRQRRPGFYDLEVAKPRPPVPRELIVEVPERLDERGAVVTPLDEAAIRAAADALRAAGAEAVAIGFLHSYADPSHERRAAAILREVWPEAYVCASSDLVREFREFERFATTAVNAALLPVIDAYLERFEADLRRLGLRARPLVMQSNGGAVSPAAVRRAPINTFFSGPAGGVIAAAGIGRRCGTANLISFDMGGTSTDVCLIRNGGAARRRVRDMGGFPVRTATLDLHTVGAGGGSIAWIDPGGLLKVGPQSAGADPGPALYGRGGAAATVTDANVVLGRLSGAALLGGAMTVFPERSRDAVAQLGAVLGLDPVATAAGIVDIVNANMMAAVRVVSIEKGEDPRDHTLVAFGGAGPLHAVEVAREMGMRRVLVPARPGLLSALGLLDADRRGDFSVTRLVPLAPAAIPAIVEGMAALDRQGAAWRAAEGLAEADIRREWSADLRYAGQAFEIAIALAGGTIDAAALDGLRGAFHHSHDSLNGYAMPGQPVELVNLRLAVTAVRLPAGGRETPAEGGRPRDTSRRPVWFDATGFVETPVIPREALAPGASFGGPAIVEQMDATTVIPPGVAASVDDDDNLLLGLAAG